MGDFLVNIRTNTGTVFCCPADSVISVCQKEQNNFLKTKIKAGNFLLFTCL